MRHRARQRQTSAGDRTSIARRTRLALSLVGCLALLTAGHRSLSAQADLQPPAVVNQSPAAASTGVSTQASVSVTFNEPIAVTTLSFSLRAGASTIPAVVSYDDATRTATLDPNDDLAGNTTHTVEVVARDVAGNIMPTPATWPFTTATPAFQQSTVFSGLTNPTVVEFARDGRVFVAEKSGIIKVFDNLTDTTATQFADLRTNVYNYHDRGLLGMTLHPDFPNTPYVYVLYAHDADIGGTAPKWSTPGATSDPCPTPPGPTADGCVISARLSRLTANGNVVQGGETVLVENWFQQYPSHSIGGLAFGADGMLYASGGDGASFNFADWGQDGNPLNPGGDPPVGVGGSQTPPTAEGGALRSQDLQTAGDPVTLDGTVIRIDPMTGLAPTDNPLFTHPDNNGKRVVAYGLRNPFRIARRPGTNEIWIGDVGWSTWEEINRLVDPTDAVVDNFAWPCYEGAGRQSSYDSANLNICEQLYATGAVTPPYFAYRHGQKVSTEACGTGSSSISGLAFYGNGTYPSTYRNGLFFSDYSRNCLWIMLADASGLPNPSNIVPFPLAPVSPADLKIGPDGDLFYVSLSGTIRRIRYFSGARPPQASAVAVPATGTAPLLVSLSAAGSTDPGGLALTYAWDLDGDGQFDDAATQTTTHTFNAAGVASPRVRVTNSAGLSDVAAASVLVSESYPTAAIATPSASLTWTVGDVITFTGSGTDAQAPGGVLPASALAWDLLIHHCPQSCHIHPVETYTGTTGGSFVAPDHDYPSWLELRLTATDSAGLQHSSSVLLYPKTVDLTFVSVPAGAQLAVGPSAQAAPFTRTVMAGSMNTVSAPNQGALVFNNWSDAGAQSHTIVAPATNTTYTATFTSAVPSNLVAAYGFNEAAGTTASDTSGNGRNGTVSGATWNASGRYGGALSFDGTNDLVSVADANALDLTTAMTLSAWLRPTTLSGWRTAILKEAPSGMSYGLYAHDNAPRPASYVNIGGDRSALGTAGLALNTWTHLATTYDGTTLRVFVNGSQVGSQAISGAMTASTGALQIGGNTVWGEYFAGLIDEVRIYSRALSAAEIQNDMNAPVAPPGPDTLAPTVTIGAPAAGPVAGTVAVSANASDNVGVTSVQFFLDGQPLGAADTTAPFGVTWNTTTVGNGQHTISATALDAAGNVGSAPAVIVTVTNDLTAPTVSITSPPAGPVLGTITVQAAASDDIGVTSVQFLLNGATLGAADTAAPYAVTWNTVGTTNGPYVLTAVAHDASGKQTTSAGVSVTVNNPPPPVDVTPPQVSITAPAGGTVSGSVTVSASASDNIGVASVQFQLDGTNLGAADTTEPYSTSWNTAGSANGPHTLTAIARDAAGNQTTSAAISVQVSNVAPTGLVAAYGFNETAGTTASDATGTGRTGTVSGASWNLAGRFGGALSFDGVNDMVTVADANALDLTNGMTISAWVRPTTLSGWRTAILKEAPTGLSYALYAHDDLPRPAAYVRLGSVDRTVPGIGSLALNTWTHLTATYDGAVLRLYVNGALAGSQAMTGSMAASTGALRIGGNSVWGEYFAGLIDEVRIYNRALSVSEIATDMNAPVGGQ